LTVINITSFIQMISFGLGGLRLDTNQLDMSYS